MWAILKRDLLGYREDIVANLAYADPSKPVHREARILFIAIDKIFALVSDYSENKIGAIKMLEDLQNPTTIIPMDVDNEVTGDGEVSIDGM